MSKMCEHNAELKTIKIGEIKINSLDYISASNLIEEAIKKGKKTTIAYANVNSFNIASTDHSLLKSLKSFDIIHPDGIGIFLASKFLYGRKGLKVRFTGSDFYRILVEQIKLNHWTVFLFGDSQLTLKKAKSANPDMKITGSQNGYEYNTDEVINKINDSMPDILLVGLPTPEQEKFVSENIVKINARLTICVGEGIKVLAGTKIRGPVILRKAGLEWMIRLICNPFKYFRRYIIGIPVFLVRIFKLKIN